MLLFVELDVQPDEACGFLEYFIRTFDRTTQLTKVLPDYDQTVNLDETDLTFRRVRTRRFVKDLVAMLDKSFEIVRGP
jgi:hypothetical protein